MKQATSWAITGPIDSIGTNWFWKIIVKTSSKTQLRNPGNSNILISQGSQCWRIKLAASFLQNTCFWQLFLILTRTYHIPATTQIKRNVKKSSSKNILPIQVARLTDWDGLALFAGFSDCHRVHLALLSTPCKSSPILHNLIASSGISTKIIVVIIVKSSP